MPRFNTHEWRHALPSLALFALLLGASGCFEAASEPAGVAQGYLVTTANSGGNAALGQATGEFRIVAANLLWSKVVDHYHHEYMAHGGDWSRNVTLLPILRTIIDLDPHFLEAYELMGSEILPRTGRLAEGKAVLAQGIRNNPQDWEIHREMAILCGWREHQPAEALPYARDGLALANDAFSQRLMTRLCQTLENDVRQQARKPASG